MALLRTQLLFRAIGPVLWRKRLVGVFYSTGEEGDGNHGMYTNNENTRLVSVVWLVGDGVRCTIRSRMGVPHPKNGTPLVILHGRCAGDLGRAKLTHFSNLVIEYLTCCMVSLKFLKKFFRSFLSDPFQGASQEAFPKEISKILMAPINHDDIEIKPDGRLAKL